MQELNIKINGMGCQACAERVDKALRQVPGVEVQTVSVGHAEVRVDPSQAGPEAVREAISQAGYEPVAVREQNR